MSYNSVSDVDEYLAHNATWLSLTDTQKKNHIATATLWLNYTYEWPGVLANCTTDESFDGLPYTLPFVLSAVQLSTAIKSAWPRVDACGNTLKDAEGCDILGLPQAVKLAEAIAVEVNLTTPLFTTASNDSDGLIKKSIKAGPVSIERQWAEPTRGTSGELMISRVDAVLANIASRRGVKTGRMPMLF